MYYNNQGNSKETLSDLIESYSSSANTPQKGLLITRYNNEGHFVFSIDSSAGRVTTSRLYGDTLKYVSVGDSLDLYFSFIGDSTYGEAFSKEGDLEHFITEGGASSNKSFKKWYRRDPFERGHLTSFTKDDSVYTGLSLIKQSDSIVGKFWETDSTYFDSTWTSNLGWTIEKSIHYDTTLFSKFTTLGELIYQSKFVYADNQLLTEIVIYPEDSVQTRDFPDSDVGDVPQEAPQRYLINGLADSPLESSIALWIDEYINFYSEPHFYVFYIDEPIKQIATSFYIPSEAKGSLIELLKQIDETPLKVYYPEGVAEIKGNLFEIEGVAKMQ